MAKEKLLFKLKADSFIQMALQITFRLCYWQMKQHCDQIWRNFTTLIKVYKSLANFCYFEWGLPATTFHSK